MIPNPIRMRAAGVAAALVIFVGMNAGAAESNEETFPAVTYGGPFELVDHDGKTVTDEDFRGEYMLMFFGYTHCPDICPTGLITMNLALKQLGEDAERIRPVFVSVDPTRDTPERLAAYVKAFNPRMVGLTGTKRQVGMAARAYKVMYFAGELQGKYVVDHTSYTYLVNPEGEYVTYFPHGIAPAEMAAQIRKHLDGS